jgi:cytochrome c551/c552
MKLLATLLLISATGAWANPFPDGNAKTGKTLFDKYKCNSCHEQMVGNGGNDIFTRANHKVHDANGLIEQIKSCSGNVGAHLSAQDNQDLGAYLNRYYKLK